MDGVNHNLLSQLFISILEFENEIYNEFPLGAQNHFFGLLIEGTGQFHSAYKDFTLHEGEIVYIPKGCVYTSYWFSKRKVRFYSLGFSFLEPEQNKRFLLQKVEEVDGLKEEIIKMYNSKDEPYSAAAIFYQLYAKAVIALEPDNRTRKKLTVYPAVKYIREHYCENITVAHVADLCGMSESYFFSVFKKEMGITPIRYKNRLKCALAAELILTGDDTLEVICEKINVSSPAFLRTLLLREMGKTPKQIRKEKYYM